jgi:hypothetical protein
MSNFIKSYQANVGLNHTPAYQVSGQPYVTASIDASSGAVSADFPYVSRWFQVINAGATPVKVGFSQAGVDGNNYFIVNASGSEGYGISEVYELKVSQVWLSGSSQCGVLAGLTSIPASRTTTDSGPSWSGSAGVG